LTSDEWKMLLRGARVEVFQKGDIVLNEGDKNLSIFQLARGSFLLESNKNVVRKLDGKK